MTWATLWVVSWALKADSELRLANPAESSFGMKESLDNATVEVLRSPMPKRSLRPPYEEPGGTRYLPGTKFSGLRGAFQ